jgi:hypothetical protein
MFRLATFLLIFLLGAFAGGTFPSYGVQYQHRLSGQLEQVVADLGPFQYIADLYHDGNLDALVAHHLESRDPTFYGEGEAIQAMIDSRNRLTEANLALQVTPARQAVYLFRNLDVELATKTWETYTPGFVTTPAALKFAAYTGIFFLLVWSLLFGVLRVVRRAITR